MRTLGALRHEDERLVLSALEARDEEIPAHARDLLVARDGEALLAAERLRGALAQRLFKENTHEGRA